MGATKKKFIVQTPRGSVCTVKTKNGKVTSKLVWDSGFSGRKEKSFGRAQVFVDSECIRDGSRKWRNKSDCPICSPAVLRTQDEVKMV